MLESEEGNVVVSMLQREEDEHFGSVLCLEGSVITKICLRWDGGVSTKILSFFGDSRVGSVQCDVEFWYRLSICCGTEENHGKP